MVTNQKCATAAFSTKSLCVFALKPFEENFHFRVDPRRRGGFEMNPTPARLPPKPPPSGRCGPSRQAPTVILLMPLRPVGE